MLERQLGKGVIELLALLERSARVAHGCLTVNGLECHDTLVRRRTPKEIAEVRAVPLSALIDPIARNANLPDDAPATDENREIKPEWIVVVGVCTHLGCTPTFNEGNYGGWLCHCHGSQYDVAGRVRRGPAPQNLAVPPYTYLTPTRLKIG